MGMFFESPRVRPPLRDALTLALMEQPPKDVDTARMQAEKPAGEVAGQVGGVGPPKVWSFVLAAALLIIVAAAALGAEAAKWTVATEELWTAFQTILGVVLGFISGDVTGAAMRGQDGG